MAYAHDAPPPAPRRRTALRTVPAASPQVYAPEPPLARFAAPAEEQSFLETLRRLWRHRLLILATTVVARINRRLRHSRRSVSRKLCSSTGAAKRAIGGSGA